MNFFTDALTHLKKMIRSDLVLLIIACLLSELTQQHFINMASIAESTANDSIKILAAIGQMLTSLCEYFFMALIVPLRVMQHQGTLPEMGFLAFFRKHLSDLLLEGIRAMGVTILWSFLLIIPGIFKYIRLFFVPYIVVADPEYTSGKRDALNYSNDLIKGFTFQLAIIMLICTGIEFFRDSIRRSNPLLQHPVMALTTGIAFYTLSLFVNILLFKVYQYRVGSLEKTAPQTGVN